MHTRTTMAALAAAGLILTGATACGGSTNTKSATPVADPSTPTTSATSTTPEAIATTATTPPPATTPEDKINTAAAEHGWILDDTGDDGSDDLFGDDTPLYANPSDFVQDICDSLPDQADSGAAQWLAQDQATTPSEMNILKFGVPLLCPGWAKTVQQAASGTYPVYIGAGTFKVTSRRADDTVPPGTYRTTGDLSGCYWERSKADGTIIDNNFATAATRITVTIRSSDDLFTSQDCGTWKPVG